MIRASVVLIFSTLLSACALFRQENDRVALTGVQQSLYTLKSWRMDGRIGVKTDARAWQANLFWEHDSVQDRVRVSGPFSQGLLSIVIQKDLILINMGDGRTELSHDPEVLLRENLGFFVPLSSLRYWILGIPDPGLPYTSVYGNDGSWGGFQQLGWSIVLDQRLDIGARILPKRMFVQGSGVRLKIIADNWDIEG